MDDEPLDLETFRTWLETRRAELLALAAHGEGAAHPEEVDQQQVGRLSRMDAMHQQAMAQESERRRQLELRRIAAALARLEEDEYGYCLRCGEAIPVARLNLDPTVTLCVPCATRAEEG